MEQKDGNTLIEVDSDYSAKWFANKVNRTEFCIRLGESISFKPRLYNVLAQNAPLTIDPEDEKHIEEEVNEINDLEDNAILAMRWAKLINRRSPHRRLAHMVLSVSSPEATNRLIANGIVLCRKKCYVEKIKKEPTRCLKCQGWNHMARDCKERDDTCSNCAKSHRTTACPHPHTQDGAYPAKLTSMLVGAETARYSSKKPPNSMKGTRKISCLSSPQWTTRHGPQALQPTMTTLSEITAHRENTQQASISTRVKKKN